MTLAVLLLSSCILGFLGAWLMRLFAVKLGLVDCPNARSSHSHPIPRGGGVGIFAAFLLSAIYSGIPTTIWISMSALTIWALLGDFVDFSPKLRLVGQLFLASIIIIANCQSPPYSNWFWISWGFWTIYLVGTANFYNFMDGINGIAGITGFIGFALLAAYIYLNYGPTSLGIVAISISLACLGFLPLNMPKARVFMGDIGSLHLGSAFGCLIYLSSETFLDFVCMTSFLFPFYADELTTMAVRLRDGEKLTQPHRRHLYQLLVNEQSIPHWQVTLVYAFLQLVVALSILLVKVRGIITILAILCFYYTLFSITTYYYRKGDHLKRLFDGKMSGDILCKNGREDIDGGSEIAYSVQVNPADSQGETLQPSSVRQGICIKPLDNDPTLMNS